MLVACVGPLGSSKSSALDRLCDDSLPETFSTHNEAPVKSQIGSTEYCSSNLNKGHCVPNQAMQTNQERLLRQSLSNSTLLGFTRHTSEQWLHLSEVGARRPDPQGLRAWERERTISSSGGGRSQYFAGHPGWPSQAFLALLSPKNWEDDGAGWRSVLDDAASRLMNSLMNAAELKADIRQFQEWRKHSEDLSQRFSAIVCCVQPLEAGQLLCEL